MSRRTVTTLLLAAAVLHGSADGVGAQDGPAAATQIWPELDVHAGLGEKTRLFFLLAPVREVEDGVRGEITDIQVGAHVDVGLLPFARSRLQESRYDAGGMRYLRLRVGIRYAEVPGEETRPEWRGIGDLTPRFFLPLDFLFAARNRIELRWIDGAFSWRYRPRLRIARETHLGERVTVVPYLSAEAFWDSRRDDWTRMQYRAGIVVPVAKWFAPGLYWARQDDESDAGDLVTNAAGLVMAFYF